MFGDNRSAFFGALTSVGALFYFMEVLKTRKSKIVLCAIIASIVLGACGTANEVPTSSVPSTTISSSASSESGVDKENDFERSQLEEISADFEETLSKLTLEMEKTIDAVGDTYEDYKSNKNLISELIENKLNTQGIIRICGYRTSLLLLGLCLTKTY